MKQIFIASSLVLFVFSLSCEAQLRRRHNAFVRIQAENRATAKRYADSLQALVADTMLAKNTADAPNNPFLFRLFTVPTIYNAPINQAFVFRDSTETATLLPTIDEMTNLAVNDAMMRSYISNPESYTYTEADIERGGGIRKDMLVRPVRPVENLAKTDKPDDISLDDDGGVEIFTHKPNFWTFGGNYSLQFMQSYVSDNWYKGGESNHSILGAVNMFLNFNNKTRLTFENTLDLKLGFQYYKDDKVHKYHTNSDLIRMTNKLGLKAVNHWYYTALLQSWTQFYRGYKNNSHKVKSDFMSPFESVFSIGMEYKLTTKKNKFNLSANIAPFACDFKYVDRSALATSFGLKANHHSKFEYGSNITINHTWKIIKAITWKGRMYYYTNYKRTQFEWENTFNFAINRFLSTQLFVYPRFDDSKKPDKGESYFQFKEYLSLGLSVGF